MAEPARLESFKGMTFEARSRAAEHRYGRVDQPRLCGVGPPVAGRSGATSVLPAPGITDALSAGLVVGGCQHGLVGTGEVSRDVALGVDGASWSVSHNRVSTAE
jgi:hypothetical protein